MLSGGGGFPPYRMMRLMAIPKASIYGQINDLNWEGEALGFLFHTLLSFEM